MKTPLFYCISLLFTLNLYQSQSLPVLKMREGTTVHILSPEPIEFIDLSSEHLYSDLPKSQIARIALKKDTAASDFLEVPPRDLGIITVGTGSFIAQYRAVESFNPHEEMPSSLTIEPFHTLPIEKGPGELSLSKLQELSLRMASLSPERPLQKEKSGQLSAALNNLYVLGDYLFLDISLLNHSAHYFSLDKVLFSLEDKKVRRLTNAQSVSLLPVFSLQQAGSFKKSFRNIYVLKKLSFSATKHLTIRFLEKQLSGRSLELSLSYRDLLSADTF